MENFVTYQKNTVVAVIDPDIFTAIWCSIQPKDRYMTNPIPTLAMGGLKMEIGDTSVVLVTNDGISDDAVDVMTATGWRKALK